jgi:hypothetical protein
MRPIAAPQSFLRFPLSHILGTEANVRTLRVLAGVDGPVTAAHLAERAGLSVPGARKTLDRLIETGVVVPVGGGRRHQFALRSGDALVGALRRLFTAEAERYDLLVVRLRRAVQEVAPPPRSAWIEWGEQRPDTPLRIGMLGPARSLGESVRALRKKALAIEREFDLAIEVTGYAAADLPHGPPEDVTWLNGVPPLPEPATAKRPIRSHHDLDQRSLAWARVLAAMIREDPSLVTRAKRHVTRALAGGAGMAARDLEEWSDILESYSRSRLLQFLTASTPRARQLRQSSPFLAVLTPAERKRLQGAASDQSA